MRSLLRSRAQTWVRGGVLGICVLSSNALASTQTWGDSSWTRTITYRAQFQSTAAMPGTIRITAVDRYVLSVNGSEVGSDDDWTDAEEYPVSFRSGSNEILARVEHLGQGGGTGLAAEIDLEDGRDLFSDIGSGPIAWRWSQGGPQGVDWNAASLVQLGSLDLSRVTGLRESSAVVIAGYPGYVDLGGLDGMVISQVEGGNLALGAPASRIEVTDGLRETSWQPGVNGLNKFVSIDLGQKYYLSRVRVVTAPPRAGGLYRDNSLRGYSVQVSEDQFRWSEVGVLHGIEDHEATQVTFPLVYSRFLRVVVAEIDGISSPQVGEIEVYGEGYHTEGLFESAVVDMGEAVALKNFGRVTWAAETPRGTTVALQFRTGDDGVIWSDWSPEIVESGSHFDAPEPARLLQYRVRMTSKDRISPRFESIAIDYSRDELPATAASASVAPRRLPMGQDTTFVVDLDLSGAIAVEVLQIQLPGATTAVDVVGYTGVVDEEVWEEGVSLRFDPPLTTSAQIKLVTAIFAPTHTFSMSLFSPGSTNPLHVQAHEEGGLTAYVDSVLPYLLSGVRASPAVFTPNGDGINDSVVLEYTLAKASGQMRATVRVFDLSGRLVRTVFDGHLGARRYARAPGSSTPDRDLPGFWDGSDAAGKLVPPGTYLFTVTVESDHGDQTANGLVAVAY